MLAKGKKKMKTSEIIVYKRRSKTLSMAEKPQDGVEAGRGKKAAVTKFVSEEHNADDISTPLKKKQGADKEIARAFLSSADRSLSKLRKRKEVPSFRQVELDEDDGEKIVGMRVKVYWSGSKKWFVGRINSFDTQKGTHKIHYDDGDKEELDLGLERFELEIKPSDGFKVQNESRSKKKVKGLDGDKLISELSTEVSAKKDQKQRRKSSKPRKSQKLKKVAEESFSKSQVIQNTNDKKTEGLILEMVADVLPEKVNGAVSDEGQNVDVHASAGEEHAEATLAEIAKKVEKHSKPRLKTLSNYGKPKLDSNECEEKEIAINAIIDGTGEVSTDFLTKPERDVQEEIRRDNDSARDMVGVKESISGGIVITSSYGMPQPVDNQSAADETQMG